MTSPIAAAVEALSARVAAVFEARERLDLSQDPAAA
ncbi:hypothetical protein J2S68_004087 [Glycomyces algeriensis]|nr:hypothetical protein [Glycomyces algeriensis]